MTRRRLRDALISLVLGFGVAIAVIAATDLRRSRAGEELGPLDFFAYCAEDYGELAAAVLWESDPQGWRCVDRSPFELHTIDLDKACTRLFDVSATARNDESDSPYTWRCYRR